ncbi:MAG: CNNM domain-containing protein, partial [Limisphaerales bacterium]
MNSDAWIVLLVKLLGLLSLVLLNALFVAAEFAYVKLRRTQLEPLIARGDRRAKAALKLVEDLDSCIGTVQVGITLCGIGMGAVVQPVFGALLGPGFALLGIETG